MKISSEAYKESAVTNAISSIRKDGRFPNKVLVGPWKDYLFFEPLMMFDPCFIDVKNLLLCEEKASVIALINLGNVIPINYDDPPVIFLEQNTGVKEYISELKSKGAPISWLFLVDRYVCASNRGGWSIYCERENDVAVFAFREGFSESARMQIEMLLKAKSIRLASNSGDSQFFDFNKLLPNWKTTLIAEHRDEATDADISDGNS
jgi:hypothetical protein